MMFALLSWSLIHDRCARKRGWTPDVGGERPYMGATGHMVEPVWQRPSHEVGAKNILVVLTEYRLPLPTHRSCEAGDAPGSPRAIRAAWRVVFGELVRRAALRVCLECGH